ncbi:MAG: acetate kinase [Nitrospiraceae bacterium]|jgi:acetate kinase|nr:acetate kinase [Nitrospiraceae bacterium]
MKVLVLNAGSSSIKYQIFNMDTEVVLTTGLLEQIGESTSRLKYKWLENGNGEMQEAVQEGRVANHNEGLKLILDLTLKLGVIKDLHELSGIGHRVVHGGEAFWKPTLINDKVAEVIREMIALAPLHNPANLMGIEVSRQLCPSVPQVAVFDTAFHQTMPPVAYHYALPYEYYKNLKVRRYGFHGTSHRYVSKQCAKYLKKPLAECNFITIHIGNGGSMTAIRGGKSVDTTMGMTPLEGLVMGTRSGDIDPAIPFYLARTLGKPFDEIETILNKQSGLKGISGANDMREIERLAAGGNMNAKLAIDMFCYRIKKYIGAYYAVLGTVDAIIFTGGIGENAVETREQICSGLEALGIVMDAAKNSAPSRAMREVSADTSRVKIMVIPTNEELEIAEQTVECIKGA